MGHLLKGCAAVVTRDGVRRDVDILTEGQAIKAIGPGLEAPGAEVTDATGWFVYPGLVNTHHHFFQCFVRNRAELDWTRLSVIEWLDAIYPIFARLTEDCFYHSSLTAMAELLKHGCTTAFDHQYCFPRDAGTRIVDRQFEAAERLGIRYHAGRGTNTLPKDEGSTIPEAMRQVALAPCQPVNCYAETFTEAIRLARDRGVLLHTHVGEGESAVIEARTGKRTVAYLEDMGFCGPDTFYAHCWELTEAELAAMAATGTGVAHCPEPVYLVGAEVTPIPAMAALGLRIGLGCDGAASNDNSNLMHCIHSAYMLQCLVAATRRHPVPPPGDFLGYATTGGAALLGRADIGALAPGMAADLFAVDSRRMDYVGTRHDPVSLPAKVGIGMATDLTMVGGRVVWNGTEFPGLDEAQMAADAEAVLATLNI